MKIIKMLSSGEVKHFGQNSYLVVNKEDAVLIDASVDLNELLKNLSIISPKPKLQAIFLTHAHFDHIYTLQAIASKFECPIYTNKFGKDILKSKDKNLSIMLKNPFEFTESRFLKFFDDGQEISIGSISIKCYLTPGHSADSSVFVIDDNMFTGDTVFKNCIGRVDLVGGDMHQMKISLNRIKKELSNGINNYYPGHSENFDNSTLSNVIDYYLK